jgi:hypothetical protein
MRQFSLKAILKIAVILLIKLSKRISLIPCFHRASVKDLFRKKSPFVIAYIEPPTYENHSAATVGLHITEFQAEFVELENEKIVMYAVVEARRSDRMIAVLRNDSVAAKATLKHILHELSCGYYVNTEFDDLRTIVDSADIMNSSNCMMLPNVVIGSGTARGDNAGMRALEIAIINTELEHAIRSKKLNGIFLIISMSQSFKKLSVETGIKRVLRKKIGFEPLTLYDTSTDDTLEDAVRVTLLAAI